MSFRSTTMMLCCCSFSSTFVDPNDLSPFGLIKTFKISIKRWYHSYLIYCHSCFIKSIIKQIDEFLDEENERSASILREFLDLKTQMREQQTVSSKRPFAVKCLNKQFWLYRIDQRISALENCKETLREEFSMERLSMYLDQYSSLPLLKAFDTIKINENIQNRLKSFGESTKEEDLLAQNFLKNKSEIDIEKYIKDVEENNNTNNIGESFIICEKSNDKIQNEDIDFPSVPEFDPDDIVLSNKKKKIPEKKEK